MVSPQNPNFAPTAVNRTWQYLCGRGLAGSVEFLLDRTREAVALFGVLREEVHYAPRHMWGPGVTLLGYYLGTIPFVANR